MAGGSVDMAVSLFFEMQGGGGGGFGGGDASPAGAAASGAPTSPVHRLLFGGEAAPPSWIEQGFTFSRELESRLGLTQEKNGPCGVLAAVNAVLIAHMGCPLPSAPVDDRALCDALGLILWRCASESKVVLAKWVGGTVGGEVEADEPFVAVRAPSLLHAAPAHAPARRTPRAAPVTRLALLACHSPHRTAPQRWRAASRPSSAA
jgi:hypothetical protein